MLNWLSVLAFHKKQFLLFIIAFSHVDLDFLPFAGLKQLEL